MALGSIQLLTKMSTRNLPGGKGRPAGKADNLTDICEPVVRRKCVNLDVLQPYGPPRPVTGIALFFLLIQTNPNFIQRNYISAAQPMYRYPIC
jgi:hypothetical protein